MTPQERLHEALAIRAAWLSVQKRDAFTIRWAELVATRLWSNVAEAAEVALWEIDTGKTWTPTV